MAAQRGRHASLDQVEGMHACAADHHHLRVADRPECDDAHGDVLRPGADTLLRIRVSTPRRRKDPYRILTRQAAVLRYVMGESRHADSRFQGAVSAEILIQRGDTRHEKAYLAGRSCRPAHEASIQEDARADAGAELDKENVPLPPSDAVVRLPDG